MTLTTRMLRDPMTTLGVAAHFLGQRTPFRDFPAGKLIATLGGQARRGHALFALEGQRVCGYVGWALYTAAEAEAFARSGMPPADPAGAQGEVVWILCLAATGRPALLACVNALRARHAGQRVMGVRHRADGRRVLFDTRSLLRAGERGAGRTG